MASSVSAPAGAARSVTEADLRRCFKKIDTDENGLLSKAEIAAFLRRHGRKVDDKEVEDALVFADLNRDGMVDFNEFIGAYLSSQPVSRSADDKKHENKDHKST